MKQTKLLEKKHCRWCSAEYYASQPVGKDGFCVRACKQAHWRAYKRYVTADHRGSPDRESGRK